MTAYCWFCEQQKHFDDGTSTKSLACGPSGHPRIDLTVKSVLTDKADVLYFLCEGCRAAILRVIAESRIVTKENVLQEAAG